MPDLNRPNRRFVSGFFAFHPLRITDVTTEQAEELAACLGSVATVARELSSDPAQVHRWYAKRRLDGVTIDGRLFLTLASVARLKAERAAAAERPDMPTRLAS